MTTTKGQTMAKKDETMRTAYLRGDTYRFRKILASKGWSWNGNAKAWTFVADWVDEAEVEREVRFYPGIRNRGSLAVELV